jgi:hypothetical protein
MTDTTYLVQNYKTSDPEFFEKNIPILNNIEQRNNICARLKELITFENEFEITAIKLFGNMPYTLFIESENIKYEVRKDRGFLVFSNENNSIPFYSGINKPFLTNEYIWFEHDRYYPKLNQNGDLQGFECHFARKYTITPGELLVETVEKIVIKQNEIIVNDTVYPFDNCPYTLQIRPIYEPVRKTIEGIMIEKYLIHFPETVLDFSNNLMAMMFGEVRPEFINPKKVSFSMAKVELIDQKKIADWELPKSPENIIEVNDDFWKKYCINFPESAFEYYHSYMQKLSEIKKVAKENYDKHGEIGNFMTMLQCLLKGTECEKSVDKVLKDFEEAGMLDPECEKE